MSAPVHNLPFPPWMFPIFLGPMWLGVGWVISRLSGWNTLALAYPATAWSGGETWHWTSATFRFAATYRNCVNVTVADQGLVLRTSLLFRFGHEPILIPWSDISVEEEGSRFFKTQRLVFAKTPDIKMTTDSDPVVNAVRRMTGQADRS